MNNVPSVFQLGLLAGSGVMGYVIYKQIYSEDDDEDTALEEAMKKKIDDAYDKTIGDGYENTIYEERLYIQATYQNLASLFRQKFGYFYYGINSMHGGDDHIVKIDERRTDY